MKPPKTIYLQADKESYDWNSEGVTRSEDRINDTDTKYLLATPEREADSDLLEALTALYEACVLADNHEELSEYVDGFLLDKSRDAIAQATETE